MPIDVFEDALSMAAHRVWVLDPHFDERALSVAIAAILHSPHVESLDVRILAKRLRNLRSEREHREKILRDLHDYLDNLPYVEWVFLPMHSEHQYPFAHDRFCVVDDELFHFGGTVGGTMAHLTAVSSGWDADAKGAVRFFTELWRDLGGANL